MPGPLSPSARVIAVLSPTTMTLDCSGAVEAVGADAVSGEARIAPAPAGRPFGAAPPAVPAASAAGVIELVAAGTVANNRATAVAATPMGATLRRPQPENRARRIGRS